MTEQDRADTQSGTAPGQWKTLREIADEIGTGKMNVYRYAKTAGLEGVTLPGAGNGQKRFYDVTAQMAIKQHFENKTVTAVTGRPLYEALQCNGEALQKPLQSNGQTATGCNGSGDPSGELHRLRQEVESLTADRDALRDQLDDAAADRETLIRQVNQRRGEITGHAAEVKRLVDQLDQLRQDHREELDRIQSGNAAELDRLREDHRQRLDDLRRDLTESRAQLDKLRQELTEERQHSRAQSDTLAQLADQAQRLQLAQMQPPAALPEEITPQEKPPTLWQRIFGKK